MNDSFINKKIKFIINIAYIFVILAIAYLSIKHLFPLVFPFITAIALCYIVEPTVQVLNRQLKIKRSICSALCIIIVLVLVCSIFTLVTTTLYTQIKSLISSLPDLAKEIEDFINNIRYKDDIGFFENSLIYLYDYIKSFNFEKITATGVFDNMVGYFTGIFKSLPNLMITCIVTLVFSVFVSSSFNEIKMFIYSQFSQKNRLLIKQVKNSIVSIFKSYVKSYMVLMLITFAELSVAFAVFNIRPAFALAFIISIIDILPIFGVGTVMIPWGIISLIFGRIDTGVIVLSIYALITVIRQIIEPKIIGTGIGLPPIVTLPAMYIGLKLFGVIGLFISPLVITVIYDLNKQGYIKILK